MKCFNCGAVLKATDYCSQCGVDVKLYRKMLQLSNAYYNEGLEKAKVRDLSGAVVALRQSLKINKHNTNARNLLGLVYFEMGEVVDALSQWIISKSYQSQKNMADYYIESVQNNPSRLEAINTTIKKYNQCLVYCEQGSYDLAIIQLKKILSVNGRLLKAHLLLALLYMKVENFGRARNELKKVLAIDSSNTRALRYMKELDVAAGKAPSKEEEKNKDVIAYTSGNETIIQPVGVNDNSSIHSILNLVIGLAIGIAVMWFLVLPAQQKSRNEELNQAITEYSEQVDSKTAALEQLQSEIDGIKAEATAATEAAEEALQRTAGYEALVKAYGLYAANDAVGAMEKLQQLDPETMDDESTALYNAISIEALPKAVTSLYNSGYAAYDSGDYAAAIKDLGMCYSLDHTHGDALYFLARAYHRSGDNENAKIYYQKVVDELPNTKRATDAAGFLNGL